MSPTSESLEPKSAEDLLNLCVRSGLISGDRLALARRHLVSIDSATELADVLLAGGVLTPWQTERLLKGKWRGFMLRDFQLTEFLGFGTKDPRGHRYYADIPQTNLNAETLLRVEPYRLDEDGLPIVDVLSEFQRRWRPVALDGGDDETP